jgi:hypothetical protein
VGDQGIVADDGLPHGRGGGDAAVKANVGDVREQGVPEGPEGSCGVAAEGGWGAVDGGGDQELGEVLEFAGEFELFVQRLGEEVGVSETA